MTVGASGSAITRGPVRPEPGAGALAADLGPGPGPDQGAGIGPGFGPGFGIDPDDLPDGLVVADETGRVICFNAAAARITAVAAADAVGSPLERALPLEDLEGRRWWALTDPYGGPHPLRPARAQSPAARRP